VAGHRRFRDRDIFVVFCDTEGFKVGTCLPPAAFQLAKWQNEDLEIVILAKK
jgi:hypothetical protein